MEVKDWLIPFLDLTTIGVCIVCKLPQINAILKTKSPKGVSVTSVMIELLGYCIVLGYNVVQGYPILSYMEYPFVVIGDIALLFVIFYYLGTLDVMKVGAVGLSFTIFVGFTQGIPHPAILPLLMKVATPCSASSKLLQLRELWRIRNSESIAILTWMISSYTCVSRIITNLLLTGDLPLLINYAVALTLNTAIVLSALYFRQSPAKISTDPRKTGAGVDTTYKSLPKSKEKAK